MTYSYSDIRPNTTFNAFGSPRNEATRTAAANTITQASQSNTIGTMVMEGLKELDPVAYVRFASVYRNFREEKDFVQFVDKIDVFKKR